MLHLLSNGRNDEIAYRDLILATGARDRVIPFPGWTLPGIYTLGGAQIALKYQGCATFAKGLWYVAALKARGVMLASGIRPLAAEGEDAVSGLLYRDESGAQRRTDCTAIGFGFGLSSETQLADLARIPFDYDPLQQQFLPQRDNTGRTPVPGVYLAGDGGGIAGADAAELSGERAALAL